jgi:hypothetical protein
VFSALNADGTASLEVEVSDSEKRFCDVVFTDVGAPEVSFAFYNAEGVRTRSNPNKAVILVRDATAVQCEWRLETAAGEVVVSGNGTMADIPVAQLAGVVVKTYNFYASVTDTVGNSTQLKMSIYILPQTRQVPPEVVDDVE